MEYDHEYKHERKDRLLEIDLIFCTWEKICQQKQRVACQEGRVVTD